jgi:hypothetical protein
LLKVGTFQVQAPFHRLSVTLGPDRFASFIPDRAFVVRSNQSPVNSFVLTGSSTIFDRLMRRQVRFVDEPGAVLGFDPVAPATRAADFARLIAQGRGLFVKEQFNGNGRAPAAHVTSRATISQSIRSSSHLALSDPLFVAETNPALAVDFEKPDL